MNKLSITTSVAMVLLCFGLTSGVTIRDTTFKDVGGKENTGWFIETKTAKWLYEAGKERSGFGELWSNDGKDWLQCYGGPGASDKRGFPNSVGNFGHANRGSGSKNTIRDDKRSGDHLIIDAENKDLHFAYHIFEDHLAVEVLKASTGYHFLFECTPGGSVFAKYWTGDGKETEVHADKPGHGSDDDLTPEWIYITDKEEQSKFKLLMVKTPEDDLANEHWQQEARMAGFSWGRHGRHNGWKGGLLEGLEHKISLAMIPTETPYEEIKNMAEALSAAHLSPLKSTQISFSLDNSGLFAKPVIIPLGSAQYRISIATSVKKLDIVDTRGATVHGFGNAGAGSYIWNGSDIAPGVYFLRAFSEIGSFITPIHSMVY